MQPSAASQGLQNERQAYTVLFCLQFLFQPNGVSLLLKDFSLPLYPNKALFFLLLSHNSFSREERWKNSFLSARLVPRWHAIPYLVKIQVNGVSLLYQSLLFWSCASKSTTGFRASAFVATAERIDLDEFHRELQTWFTAAAGLKIRNKCWAVKLPVSSKQIFQKG